MAMCVLNVSETINTYTCVQYDKTMVGFTYEVVTVHTHNSTQTLAISTVLQDTNMYEHYH